MGHRQDCQFAWLGSEGYVGTTVDRWSAWLTDQGFTGQINDQEFAWLGSLGYTGQLNDRWFAYLRDQGATGALPDMMTQFWCGEGGVDPGPVVYLLDARFDYFMGIEDQPLSDAQVLGELQGVEVGSLVAVFGIGSAARIEGGKLFASSTGQTTSFRSISSHARVRGLWNKQTKEWTGSTCSILFMETDIITGGNFDVEMRFNAGGNVTLHDGGGLEFATYPGLEAGQTYTGLVIIDTVGAWFYIKGGNAWPEWTLLHVYTTGSATPLWLNTTHLGGSESSRTQVDFGTDATAVLDADAGLSSGDPSTVPAIIDNLKGDIVSASFGPAAFHMADGDELWFDYPANGVGKIRRAGLLCRDATGDKVQLRGGLAIQNIGSASSSKLLSELVAPGQHVRGIEAGLTARTVTYFNDVFTSAYAFGFRRTSSTGGAARIIEVEHSSVGDAMLGHRVRDGAAVIETVDNLLLVKPNVPYDIQVTLGGYNDAGEPDPDGLKGGVTWINGKVFMSSAIDNLATAAGLINNDQNNGHFIDSLQTYINKPALRTPQRALFATDHANIADYVPENGVPFIERDAGRQQIVGGRIEPTSLGASYGLCVIDNPGGYYWESEYFLGSGNIAGHSLIFRYKDGANFWRADGYVSGANWALRLAEVVDGVLTARAGISPSTIPLGSTTRMIVTDDGTNMTMIHPESGEVVSYASTANSEYSAVGVGHFTLTTLETWANWYAARTGTVRAYTP